MAQNLPIQLKKSAEETKGAEQHASEQTARMRAWLRWAKETLGLKNANDDTADFGGEYRPGSQLDKLRLAANRDELKAIEFDKDDLAVVAALDRIFGQKSKPKYFENAKEPLLLRFLRGHFKKAKEYFRDRLIEDEARQAAEDNIRAQNEQNARFYGEFRRYRVTDDMGVEEDVPEDSPDGPPPLRQWVQISRTRIDLEAVTRSKKDDDWGVYIRLRNMDARETLKSIPRSIITDLKGSVAGDLAKLGAAIVRTEIGRLPAFLLTTVTETPDGYLSDLPRFLAVPTTGWCQLENGQWVFVLPHTTKFSKASPGFAVFQNPNLHLQYGISTAGGPEDWRTQIAVPLERNSNVILAVGQALAGPLMNWAGVPPGMFHICCASKYGKSLAAAVGQSIYGPPLVPNETVPDPFGQSWLSTANAIGQTMKVRTSLCAFFDEINQGDPKAIADAAYRIANGIDKARMGRELESRPTHCIPGFSTGEMTMVSFLVRNGQTVTHGMRTRIADVPAEVQPKSVFEEYGANEVVGLGKKYYPLLGRLHGAVGAEWISRVVDLVNLNLDDFQATISRHQQDFLARAKVRTLYDAAEPWQCSVLTRFATVAAACRIAIDPGVLPWQIEDTDIGIERCVERWAGTVENVEPDAVVSMPVAKVNTVVVDEIVAAIVAVMNEHFMDERKLQWVGTAEELADALNKSERTSVSARSLGRWLSKEHARCELKKAGFEIARTRDATSRMIHFSRIKG